MTAQHLKNGTCFSHCGSGNEVELNHLISYHFLSTGRNVDSRSWTQASVADLFLSGFPAFILLGLIFYRK